MRTVTPTNVSSYASYAGAALEIGSIASSRATEEEKFNAIRERIGLTVADYYTGGVASLVVGFLDRTFPSFMGGVRKVLSFLDPLGTAVGKLFDTDRWKTEGNRLRALIDQGVHIPDALRGPIDQTHGRSKEELLNPSLPPTFVGIAPNGEWVNNSFALSRSEADLRAEDIWGSAAFFEKFGNKWLGDFSTEQRRAIAQLTLQQGAVREHVGTISIRWSPELDREIQRLVGASA